MQRISRGVESTQPGDANHATVLIESHAIPFASRAPLYREGAKVRTSFGTPDSTQVYEPQGQDHNYLNLVLETWKPRASSRARGRCCWTKTAISPEGRGSNIFLVKDGQLSTPRGQFVLEGITRNTVLGLAEGLDIPTAEQDIDLFDAYTADEAF